MIKSGIRMKRDMDLIREILLAIEESPHGFAPDKIMITGYSDEQIQYHAYLLGEAGLAKVVEITSHGDKSPNAVIQGLTWEGYEFLDSAREKQRWNQAKELIGKVGGASLQIWTMVLADLVKKNLGL